MQKEKVTETCLSDPKPKKTHISKLYTEFAEKYKYGKQVCDVYQRWYMTQSAIRGHVHFRKKAEEWCTQIQDVPQEDVDYAFKAWEKTGKQQDGKFPHPNYFTAICTNGKNRRAALAMCSPETNDKQDINWGNLV